MRIVISGSSGLIGTELTRRFRGSGHDVTTLVRRPASAEHEVEWDPEAGRIDPEVLAGVDLVVNLNGRSIGERRWAPEEKQLLWDSRIDPTALLASTMAGLDDPPAAFLSASAIGIYGDRGDEILTEDAAPGSGFLADLAVAWEAATEPAAAAGVRTVTLRTSIVLSAEGGALGRMMDPFGWGLNPYKLGLGGKLGSGRQWWSWIALEDQIAAIEHLASSSMGGAVNVASPDPIRNKDFIEVLGDVIHRPTVVPTPRFALNAILGKELAQALLFDSTRVVPSRLTADGFSFSFSDLAAALRSELDG